jgi:hypothetical protein
MIPDWIKGSILFVLTAAAGMLIGIAWERHHGAPPHPPPPAGPHVVMHRLGHDLQLDSAQQVAIAAILQRRQGAVDSTWRTMHPHMRATLDTTIQEILGVLRPDQATTYRAMVEVMHPGVLRHPH